MPDYKKMNPKIFAKGPHELEGDQLVMNRLRAFEEDYKWRKKWVDFDKCTKLYEARTSHSSEKGIPRRNLIRRAVDDHHAVVVQNVPKLRMHAERYLGNTENFLEREIASLVQEMTEKTGDSYVKTILADNQFADQRDMSIKHASIYGVGHVGINLDESVDTRHSAELRALVEKPLTEWTDLDHAQYEILKKRIEVRFVDTRDVYWQHGIRRVGPEMLRVSLVERFETESLRRIYNDPNIRPARLPHSVDEDPYNEGNVTARLTTWELVPYQLTKSLESPDGSRITSIETTDWIMVKTVIAGGVLVEKTVYANYDDEGMKVEKNFIALPIKPLYTRESEQHPYGFAIPEQLELSEEFINRMYFIMYKAAKKAVSNQGIIVNMQSLGPGDLEKINAVLDEGGVAPIQGNEFQSQNPDIRTMVQPLNYTNSSLPAAMIQAVQSEEKAFQSQSDTINDDAINRARSGSAKRAQIAADDRPKTIAVNLLSRSLEDIYDHVWGMITKHHTQEVAVPVDIPGVGRQVVNLNQKLTRVIPEFDAFGNPVFHPAFVSPDNPNGLVMKPVEFVVNSTAVKLKARADGRSELPQDFTARFQILVALRNAGAITDELLRYLTLPEELKAMDDGFRQAIAEQQQLLPAQTQSNGNGQVSFPTLPQANAQAPLIQDQQELRKGSEDFEDSQSL